ncbi:MAG: molybdate ABC transporter substrate-binding protein [Gammaproteobacteria bacterium]|jgi:molybdate transport system substrate-binding protein
MKKLGRYLCTIVLLAATTPAPAATLTVAVAANVQFAFKDLQTAFTRESGIDVQSVIGSSGKISAQVRGGAPFDIFLSADMGYPRALYREGLASGAPVVYAYGTLVLWTMNDLDLTPGLKVLADTQVARVAIANPKLAPYGRAALQALAHYRIATAVRGKTVYGESVSQVNQYIYSGNVDAGFTAKSVVLSPTMRDKGKWIEVPPDGYQPIAQGVVILKHGADNALANCKRFIRFLASAPARKVLADYGYRLP